MVEGHGTPPFLRGRQIVIPQGAGSLDEDVVERSGGCTDTLYDENLEYRSPFKMEGSLPSVQQMVKGKNRTDGPSSFDFKNGSTSLVEMIVRAM